ncbi:hypothetical protein CHL78_005470 [Romboutsia weinsteinii]|uniref:Uncharacterized protein n=2 Tax=Romboutsia weinsteinii TaxID=2020949 RepID=A0A371J6E0_9FIRM|nr:hypothetical protein CHL78_005470 [Romboutsia weinsteinii]
MLVNYLRKVWYDLIKRIIILMITLLASALFAIGCTKEPDINLVSLDLIDIPMINNNKIKEIISDKNLEDGVYIIETNSNKYIYFNGVNNLYSNIYCNLVDNTLEIHAESNTKLNNKQGILYIISSLNEDIFDEINLKVNNKSENFKNVYRI